MAHEAEAMFRAGWASRPPEVRAKWEAIVDDPANWLKAFVGTGYSGERRIGTYAVAHWIDHYRRCGLVTFDRVNVGAFALPDADVAGNQRILSAAGVDAVVSPCKDDGDGTAFGLQLEIGDTDPSTTMRLIGSRCGVVRWPYGDRYLTICRSELVMPLMW